MHNFLGLSISYSFKPIKNLENAINFLEVYNKLLLLDKKCIENIKIYRFETTFFSKTCFFLD